MRWKTTLPTVASLSVLGALSGVWLAGEAIGEIDPFYYQQPESSFVSDRLAYRSPDWAGVQIGEYQQQGLLDGIGAGPVAGPVYAAPAVATYGESWAADARREARPAVAWVDEEPVQEEIAPPPEPEPDPEIVRIHRYASYRISQEETETGPVQEEGAEVYAAADEAPAE